VNITFIEALVQQVRVIEPDIVRLLRPWSSRFE
jgi:hypothetical protein